MAGKSSKGKNRKGSANCVNSSESASLSNASATVNSTVPSNATVTENPTASNLDKVEANGVQAVNEQTNAISEAKDETTENSGNEAKQGELHLYPVSVKTESGEKLELQLNPADSVMDVRQFLLEAQETCFFTCYDLLLHTKDGVTHQLEDYNEISEVADITTGGCSLEMVAAHYDDRSIRAHVNRTRELLSLSSLHSSLSTSLALEYENAQNKNAGSDAAKIEVPELDGLGFMEDVTGSLGKLLPTPSKETKCVESIVFSSFNPPPSYRRLVGDLIYLDVTTLEGNKYCISGTTRAFYVNSSSGNVLDPRPKQGTSEATTLIALLRTISSGFKKAFHEILERKASAHSFENVQSLLPPNSWLGLYPIPSHRRDAARAENALTLSYGSEVIGMQTDWNEQLQSCREFPHSTPQERILRDRALYKVTSEFVDAAINGAIGVINRCIPPINPTDPECFHMYVHNNIFFSFAVDADLEQMPKKHSSHSKSKTEKISPSAEKVPIEPDGVSTAGNANDVSESTEQLSDEAHLAESEQATYASANNDLKGTKAYQEADIPGLYNLAMAIIDYRGHRVVAQSVLPGILHGDKSDSLLYGSVDNGKKICWNEDFHSKVLDAAKRLHLKEHKVLDGSGNEYRLAAPVECKGIVGSDDRHYLLDLMRVTPRDANYTGPGSRFCILRPELISAYCQAQAVERSKKKPKSEGEASSANGSSEGAAVDEQPKAEAEVQANSLVNHEQGKDAKSETIEEWVYVPDGTSESDEILFNPNVFTEFKLAGNPEEISRDEENVRKVGSYLAETVLPKFIQDLCSIEVSPMDGQTLTEALHAHGINVRYIGKVAEGTKHLPHLWDLCSNEIVVRSAKHIIKDVLRDTEDHELGPAISHFLNILFGSCQAVGNIGADSSKSRLQKKDHANHQSSKSHGVQTKLKATSGRKNLSCYRNISSEALWSDIREFAKLKYQFELPEDARSRVKKVSVLRNLCQKVGITLAARKYDLSASTPFQPSDILDLRPVVKHSVPVCSEAKDLVEAGKAQLAEYMLSEAFNSFSEAFAILQQVTGPMHREVANCCRYLAMVLYHAGDIAGAIMQQHKELIINERCLGLDHPDTAHSYGNMALFYHGLNQTELALRHMSRALLLLSLSSGPDHPDVAATFINVAMMYQDIGKMHTALRYLQEALKKNERLLGEEHIQTALCYHALAIAFSCMGAFKLSCQHEKKTHDILVKQLGPKDSRTRDSENWLNTFKKRQEEKGQALNSASAQKAAVDILKAAAARGSRSATLNAAIIGETLSRGKRPDARAARAAEEMRKKAAAKGLINHQNGAPVQAMPEISQVLLRSILNSGLASESQNEGTNAGKNEGNNRPSNEQTSGQEQPPAGLGQGLSSLDAKKQKVKSKVAA